jgi:hypothetical protein
MTAKMGYLTSNISLGIEPYPDNQNRLPGSERDSYAPGQGFAKIQSCKLFYQQETFSANRY